MSDIVFINSMYSMPQDRELYYCKENTGNLVWHDMCKKIIKHTKEVNIDDVLNYQFNSDDILVIPMANNLSEGETYFSKQLRKFLFVNAKIVIMGLGIQGSLDMIDSKKSCDEYISKLSDSKKRLFIELSKKTACIGVRGNYTKMVLEKMGIKNVCVIGCPSFYSVNRNKYIMRANGEKIIFNYSNISKEKQLYRLINKLNYTLIRQSKRDIIPECLNSKLYTDLSDWNNELKKDYVFCFGTRLHGNMYSYLNGIPSLWIVHDIRTYEVCEALKLPYVMYNDAVNASTIYELWDKCNYSDDFYTHRDQMYEEFDYFLSMNSLERVREE